MKIFMRVVVGILVAVVVLAAVLVLARNVIIKAGAGATIKAITGVDMKIKTLDIGLFKPVVQIKDLKLLNPGNFPENMMMSMPELYVQYDLPSIMKGVIHLPELRVNMSEFIVVKNLEGAINVNSLQALQPPKGEGKPPQIQIDTMELHVGKVVYKEFRASGAPRESVFDINLNERYENISDPNVLVALIVSKSLRNTTISGISGTLKSAEKLLGGAAGLVVESGKKVTQDALKAAGSITNTLESLIGQ